MATELDALEDEKLMELVQHRNESAFAVLVRRHTNRFYAVAYRSLKYKEYAEDAVQESFLKLWDAPHHWNKHKHAKFTTWFYKIVLNRCLDFNKKKIPERLEDKTIIEDAASNPLEILDEKRQQKQLETAIQSLPERQKTALNLCVYEGLSNPEAAHVMGVRIKALQSLIMRAKTNITAFVSSGEK